MGAPNEVNFEEFATQKPEIKPVEYRKKPVVVTALKWDGTDECLGAIVNWMGHEVRNLGDQKLGIETLEGTMEASIGDYIIKGVKGEYKDISWEKAYCDLLNGSSMNKNSQKKRLKDCPLEKLRKKENSNDP